MTKAELPIEISALEEVVIGGLDDMPPDVQAMAIQTISRTLGKRAVLLLRQASEAVVSDMVKGVAQDATWLTSERFNNPD